MIYINRKGPSKRLQHLLQHPFDFVEEQCRNRLNEFIQPFIQLIQPCWMSLNAFKPCFNICSTFLLLSRMLNEVEAVCRPLSTPGSFSNDDGNENVTWKCNFSFFAIIPICSTCTMWAKYPGTNALISGHPGGMTPWDIGGHGAGFVDFCCHFLSRDG